jgi:hypothetical protein
LVLCNQWIEAKKNGLPEHERIIYEARVADVEARLELVESHLFLIEWQQEILNEKFERFEARRPVE